MFLTVPRVFLFFFFSQFCITSSPAICGQILSAGILLSSPVCLAVKSFCVNWESSSHIFTRRKWYHSLHLETVSKKTVSKPTKISNWSYNATAIKHRSQKDCLFWNYERNETRDSVIHDLSQRMTKKWDQTLVITQKIWQQDNNQKTTKQSENNMMQQIIVSKKPLDIFDKSFGHSPLVLVKTIFFFLSLQSISNKTLYFCNLQQCLWLKHFVFWTLTG